MQMKKDNHVAAHPKFTAISLCTGVGMLDHGLNIALAGALEPVLMVEREAFCVANLAWQMEQDFLSQAHIWDDVKTVTRPRVCEIVGARLGGRRLDFIFGGIPCQPHSQAGKRLGSMDERDLWPATLAAVAVYQPKFVFIENVDGIASNEDGAVRIICDLEKAGYQTKAGLFSSKECGGNHQRKRWFFLGIANGAGCERQDLSLPARQSGESGVEFVGGSASMADAAIGEFQNAERREGRRNGVGQNGEALADSAFRSNYRERDKRARRGREHSNSSCDFPRYAPARNDFESWAIVAELDPSRMPAIESSLRGVVDGLAGWNHQLHAIGNGVDPLVSAYAFVTLFACVSGE